MSPMPRPCLAIVALILSLISYVANANEGYELLGVGPVAESLSGAGVASPHDATWTLLNPATLTALEKRLDLSYEILAPRRSMDPDGPIIVPIINRFPGKQEDNTVVPIPDFGMVLPLHTGTLGFGAFGWAGTGVDYKYSRTTIGAVLGHSDRRADYYIAKIPLAYAYEFDNGVSVGLAVHLDWQRLRTDTLSLRLIPAGADYGWDDTVGLGFQVGVYKKWDRFAVGATYSTRNWTLPFQRYDDLLDHRLDLPAAFQGGVSYRANDKLELLLDYRYIDYTGVKQLADKPIHGGLGWKDEHLAKLGAIYTVNDQWTVRAGMSDGIDPLRPEVIFANAEFPGIADLHVSFGVTYVVDKHSEIHFVYSHAFKREETDNGKGDIFSKLGKGTTISLEEDAYGLGYTYKF